MSREKNVADRSAADRRHQRKYHHTDEIEPLATGGERAADREHGHAHEIEYVEEMGEDVPREVRGHERVLMGAAAPPSPARSRCRDRREASTHRSSRECEWTRLRRLARCDPCESRCLPPNRRSTAPPSHGCRFGWLREARRARPHARWPPTRAGPRPRERTRSAERQCGSDPERSPRTFPPGARTR